MNKEEISKALDELRTIKKRKFSQTVELIINLKDFDVKRENLNLIATIPHKFKEKRIAAFLTKKSKIVDTITKEEFVRYKDKNAKKLAESYDTFISIAQLMPAVATSFGKILGPLGKMPNPQLGMLMKEDDDSIKALVERLNNSIKIRSKEASLKIAVAKENMKNQEIIENIEAVYKVVFDALPRKKDNIKSVLIKFTMTKPIKLEF